MQAAKEAVANIGASAKSGMEKTKATVQEKAEKLTAQHPAEKEMAERRKHEKIRGAETRKQEAMGHNAAARAWSGAGPVEVTAAQNPVPGQPAGVHVENVESGAAGTDHTSVKNAHPAVGGV